MSATAPSFYATPSVKAFWRRRDHAQIEAMTGLILQRIGYPTRRHRDFICALQSAQGSNDTEVPYTPFKRAHATLAQYMQIGGDPESQRKAVYREIQVLRAFSERTGILLFHVKPGSENEKTEYIDYLTPTADEAMQRALASPLWKKDKSAAKAEAVEWAVAQLPRIDVRSKEEKVGNLLPLDQYEQAQEKRICDTIEKVADEIEKRGGDDFEWMQRVARQLLRVADSRRRTAPARRDYATLSYVEELEAKREGNHPVLSGSTTGDSFDEPNLFSEEHDERGVMTELSPPPEEKANENGPFEVEAALDMLSAALEFARNGYAVIPLYEPTADGICTCRAGTNCDSPGKHPRISAWQQKASRDQHQVKRWWRKWPTANIGIATGKPSACIVLDIDISKGGGVGLATLLEQCELPPTLEVQSGSGAHLYFAYEGHDIKNSACRIGEGLDIRGQGGFIVAWPSLHACGKRYRLLNDHTPTLLPAKLRELLLTEEPLHETPKVRVLRPPTSSTSYGAVIPEGQRNDWLFRKVACRLRGMGAGFDEIISALHEARDAKCDSGHEPVTDSELLQIAKSSMRYAPNAV
jgi:hypothetical protein